MGIIRYRGQEFRTSRMVSELGHDAFGVTPVEWFDEIRAEEEFEQLGIESKYIEDEHGQCFADLSTLDGSRVLLYEDGSFHCIRKSEFLTGLDFGKDYAEAEIVTEFLDKVFVKTESFKNLLREQKTIITGRRGVGKSAMSYYLIRELHRSKVSAVRITPDRAVWHLLSKFELKDIPGIQAYRFFWRFTFLVHTAKHIVESEEKDKGQNRSFWNRDILKLDKFLMKAFEREPITLLEIIGRAIRTRWSGITIAGSGISVEPDSNTGGAALIRVTKLLEAIEEIVGRIDLIRKLALLIDQIDHIWDGSDSSNACVVGLLEAVKDMNSRFRGIKAIAFIRTDIYDNLEWPDKEQVRSEEFMLEWTKKELRRLIATRIKQSLMFRARAIKSLYEDHIFGFLFPSPETMDFIIERTFRRPRDMIQFCNKIRDKAHEKGHTEIKEGDISEAFRQYSRWKRDDLVEEYRVGYPFLKDLIKVFRGIKVPIPSVDLCSIIKEAIEKKRISNLPDTLSVPEDIIELLFEISFLGVKRADQTIFSFLAEDCYPANEKLFVIHPAFSSALNLEHVDEEIL